MITQIKDQMSLKYYQLGNLVKHISILNRKSSYNMIYQFLGGNIPLYFNTRTKSNKLSKFSFSKMHLIFNGNGISIELDVNPTDKIGDIIKVLKTRPEIQNNDVQLIYKLKPQQPETTLKELNAQDNDVFIMEIKAQQKRRPVRSLPSRSDIKIPTEADDPPNFEEDVASLMELGYPKSDCETALRVSFYNVDRACIYLVEGNIPKRAGPEHLGHSTTPKINFLDRFSPEDLAVIAQLANEVGLDQIEVAQCYAACEKNVEKTRNCISATSN